MSLNYKLWTVEEVTKWLESINLHTLIPMFERLQITGQHLTQIDDTFMRETLRITKPAEMTVLRGAILNLNDPAAYGSVRSAANRKVSAPVPRPPMRDRSGSLEGKNTYPQMTKKASGIMPTTIPRNFTVSGAERDMAIGTREPRLKKGASAPEVLDDRCRYSGWIRKQGGGYKSWKRRYMVLRLGCLYYFANETAKEPKGCFTLAGYGTEICNDQEILKKQKWTLKVEPVSGNLRTYYISVGAKRELHAWKQAIDEEISACARRPRFDDRVPGGGVVIADVGAVEEVGEGSSDEEEGDEEPIYDQPDDGDEFDEDGEPPIYDRPEDEEDDPYSEISEDILPGVHSHGGSSHGGKPGAPTVPVRSPVSLRLDQKQAPPSAAMRVGLREEPDDDTYLRIIGPGSASAPATTSLLSSETPSISSTTSNFSVDKAKHYSPPHNPITEKPEDKDYEDDGALSGEDYREDDSDAYYVVFRKPEEMMPPSCLFDNLDRAEADRLLRAKGVDGTYLIRAGSRAGSEKVLSVWHADRCRHYKLFKDENSQYSLTQGRTFGTIPELLQNYWQSDHLPRSEFHLTEPFYPDH